MADRADDDVTVHEGRKVGLTVSLRLKPDEAEMLAALSQRYEMTLSDTMRLALTALAQAADYTKLTVQSSGIGDFTRAEARSHSDGDLALTA
jgi:hypothetical protein